MRFPAIILAAFVASGCSDNSNKTATSSHNFSETELKMLNKRHILVGMPIDDAYAEATISKIRYLNEQDPKSPIFLLINSPGGAIPAVFRILEAINQSKSPIHTYGFKNVNGIALWILAAGETGHRYILNKAYITIEKTTIGEENTTASEQFKKINTQLASSLAAMSNLSNQDILDALKKGRVFTPAEAIDVKLVDGYFDPTQIK